MTTRDVAEGLVERCRRGDFLGAVDTYYGDDIVSVEPVGSPQMPAELRGIQQVRGKNEWWEKNAEVHSVQVEGPFLGERNFAVRYTMDVTMKPTGERTKMTEMALYTVEDGRITREEFYYNAPDSGSS